MSLVPKLCVLVLISIGLSQPVFAKAANTYLTIISSMNKQLQKGNAEAFFKYTTGTFEEMGGKPSSMTKAQIKSGLQGFYGSYFYDKKDLKVLRMKQLDKDKSNSAVAVIVEVLAKTSKISHIKYDFIRERNRILLSEYTFLTKSGGNGGTPFGLGNVAKSTHMFVEKVRLTSPHIVSFGLKK